MNSERKVGFFALVSLVAGSQIGTGIFLLPSSIAPFGAAGLSSWLITATGAILLALIFARLCTGIVKTGGPHVFIESAFGKTFGYFSAWTYWVISWLSTPVVVISVVSYLTPVLGDIHPLATLLLELGILAFITGLNLSGMYSAGRIELVFTLLKLLPLLVVPIAGIFFFNPSHFVPFNPTEQPVISVMNAAALLTLWGFIGIETATTPAGSVENPKRTIPRAIITGTLLVAAVYIFSSVIIMGVVPQEVLMHSKAPFADAARLIFGGNWYLVISIAASIVCLGTLNSWVLTSGQIALGAASDGHLPRLFTIKNARGAPLWGVVSSSLGMIPILLVTLNRDWIAQVNWIIDVSVTAFLFIYTLSTLSFLKLFFRRENGRQISLKSLFLGVGALIFCGWALYSSGVKMVMFAGLIPLTGLPIYLWKKRRKNVEDHVTDYNTI